MRKIRLSLLYSLIKLAYEVTPKECTSTLIWLAQMPVEENRIVYDEIHDLEESEIF